VPDLRITAGELGGRRIAGPGGSDEVRPTTERVREAVFSMLGEIAGARALDLYSGTGALAIEALSRGAAEATLVDTSPGLARGNIERLGLQGRARAVRADALDFLDQAPPGAFDLVLCDPPYGDLTEAVRARLDESLTRVLAPGGRVVIESSPRSAIAIELPLLRERAYGDTLVRVYASPEEAA
jgi:16S rRNA (guanine966-N2)-methyltransferase